jgi:endonuclease YncB( thermonuclease family)
VLLVLAVSVALTGTAPVVAHVERVVDGDTLWVRTSLGRTDVRLLGIDCPESKHNAKCRRDGDAACNAEVPRGKAATRRARELLHPGDAVTLEPGGTFQRDRYGRTLAYVVPVPRITLVTEEAA